MSDAHGAHREAVLAAQAAIGEVQELISAATAKLESEAVGAVYNATGGENCNMESGRMAFQWASGLQDRFDELYRITDNINTELSRYHSGF